MAEHKNPIKHIKFSDSDYTKPVITGGGSAVLFKEIDKDFIGSLIDGLKVVELNNRNSINWSDEEYGVAVVTLESNAVAKSHRPTKVFNNSTCPFFGDVGFGKFLIRTSKRGISKLTERIQNATAKSIISEISTIRAIEPFTPNIQINNETNSYLVRLFRFDNTELNQLMDGLFEELLNKNKINWKRYKSESIRLYMIESPNIDNLYLLEKFTGMSHLIPSDTISVEKPSLLSEHAPISANFELPEEGVEYPTVAVVDTAMNANCPLLSPWIVAHESFIVKEERIENHGTFVGALITNSYNLNGNDGRFPLSRSKLLSVEVLGKDNGSSAEIIEAMYEVAETYPEVKVWNLSLGSLSPASMDEVSDFAVMLDEFQDRNDCFCVVSAGNSYIPRTWPADEKINYEDGVSSPGDSTRALTVGSVAHVDGLVKCDEPSPFSRRGPVSNFIQKPEVVHYGGNMSTDYRKLGVFSLASADSKLAEDIGTSFSTPLVSTISANLYQRLGTQANRNLIKALMIHSATLNSKIREQDKPYLGWGLPLDIDEVLSVKDYEMTITMEGLAKSGEEIQKLPFPIPSCLRTSEGKVRAEFIMTLVYNPPVNANKAFEYCQVNIDVGLGSIEIDENGKQSFNGKIPNELDKHNYEEELVKNGGKWSPVKVYKKSFPRGVDVDDWKLRLTMLTRSGYEPEEELIPFSLIITIRDLDKEQPVYNQMTQLMNDYNWEVSNLGVQPSIKV